MDGGRKRETNFLKQAAASSLSFGWMDGWMDDDDGNL